MESNGKRNLGSSLPPPPAEGKLIRGFEGLDVGDRVRVQLIGTDVERGFIDFADQDEATTLILQFFLLNCQVVLEPTSNLSLMNPYRRKVELR